jgi:hypothetical protein
MSFRSNDLLRVARENGILDDEEVRRLVLAAGLSGNQRLEESVRRAVLGRSVQRWKYPFDEAESTGSVELGSVFRGGRFRVSQEDLCRHLLAVGQSGSGKTTLFYNLYGEVGVPCWFFDLKQDYRHLVQEEESLLVLPWGRLCLNPLRPPRGVSPRRWAQVFSEVFGHSTALLSGSKNYMLKSVLQLYRAYNLFEEVSPPYPSMHELQRLVESDQMNYMRKQANYRDTLLNRLEAMNLVAGSVFDCSQGYSIEKLLEKDVVFEFDGLSRDVQNFLMEVLFALVYEYRLSNGERGDDLRHLFFLDEGKRVFSVYKERQEASGIPEIDELTAKMREFGEGLVVGDQEPAKLTDSIKANTFTKFILPLGDRGQFDEVADALNLSERQRDYAQQLGTGEAVVQAGNDTPVPVDLENYRLEKQVTDKELKKLQAPNWSQLNHTERSTTPEFRSLVAPGRSDEVDEPEIIEETTQEEISLGSEPRQMLKDVVENPFQGLTKRYEEFSSSYKGNKAKNELVDEGVVIERKVHTQQGKRKLLQFTDKGRDYIEDQLDLDPSREGRGGVVHRYWQHRIKDLFEEAGWHAFLEKFDADVYVNMGDTELVVEVAMGNNQREIQHIKKHLDKEFVIWVACRNQEIRDKLNQRMKENDLNTDGVVFRLFRDFNNKENLPS